MKLNNDIFIHTLVSDEKGKLIFADEKLKEIGIGDSLLHLTGTNTLPTKYPRIYHTVYGFLIIYPFSCETLRLQGYLGFLTLKCLRDEIINSLVRNNQILSDIIEEVHDGILVTDGKGEVIKINKGFEKLSGIPRETMINKYVGYGVEAGSYSASATVRVLETKKPVTFHNVYFYNNKHTTGIVTGKPVFDEDNNICLVVCNIRDFTKINHLRDKLFESQLQTKRYSKIVEKFNQTKFSSEPFIYKSPKMEKIIEIALKYAKVDAPLLITGESGSGKEMLTDFIHKNSNRKNAPFLKINCGAIPEALLESELFGYEEGSFTGAKKGGHMGLFELAHKGTLLLDEIGELSLGLQSKLLRFIEKKEFYRLGNNKQIKVDVRIISATNRDLKKMIAKKQFRMDLFYRLNVFNLFIPPLRERIEDIIPLVNFFVEQYNRKYHTDKKISPLLLELFKNYQWTGNVRELENLIERLVVVSDEEIIQPQHLPDDVFVSMNKDAKKMSDQDLMKLENRTVPVVIDSLENVVQKFPSFHEARDFFEKIYLYKALEKYGSIRNTAAHIGLSHPAIIKKLSSFGMKAPTQK